MASPPRCPVCRGGEVVLHCRKEGAAYHRCRGCGLIFQDPLPDRLAMRSHADDQYESGAYSGYVGAKELKLAHFRQRLAQFAERVPRGRLLDVGCSCGYFLEVALAQGFDAHGIEFSAAAVAAADPAVRPRIIPGNVNDLSSFHLEPFDLVTAFDIIEHTEDPAAFLRQVRGLLRPGGSLVLSTPDTGHFLQRLLGRRWPMLQPLQHTVLFSRRAMTLCLEEAGFGGVTIQTARKVVTVDYLLDQVRDYFPAAHRWYARARGLLPRGLRERPRAVNIGEMLAVGVARGRVDARPGSVGQCAAP